MKTILIGCLILLMGLFLPGCITSLHPLYTAEDLIFDKRLVGTWLSDNPGESWKIENLLEKKLEPFKDEKERKSQEIMKSMVIDKNSYLLTYTEKGQKAEFVLNLISLDNNLYIDLYPGSLKTKNDLFDDHFLPVHSYARIDISNSGFKLYFFNAEHIYKLLSENRIKIKHESFEYYKVITASTEELQKFVKKYGDDKNFFMTPVNFRKSS